MPGQHRTVALEEGTRQGPVILALLVYSQAHHPLDIDGIAAPARACVVSVRHALQEGLQAYVKVAAGSLVDTRLRHPASNCKGRVHST